MSKLQRILATVWRTLKEYYDPAELKPLLTAIPDGVIIRNTMASEPEMEVVASMIDSRQIPEHLLSVPEGNAGKNEVMRDDFLPFVGRMLVRLAHFDGDQVFLSYPNHCQEAVIITGGYAIKLVPGKEVRRAKAEQVDEERFKELVSIIDG
ncbi:MAG: hypothetical protein WCV58_01705 [Patescibacteria group bacterium]